MLTSAEVAKLLNVTPRRVRALKSKIGYELHGGMLFYPKDAVQKYIDSRKKK